MNSLLERGLKAAASTLGEALDSSPTRELRPQQLDTAERTPRSRQRGRQTEEQAERDTTSEEAPPVGPELDVGPITRRRSSRATSLRRQLHDRDSVRNAFLMMELLDKPRAMRPHQQR